MQAIIAQIKKWNSRKLLSGVAAIVAILETQADATVQVAGIAAVGVSLIFGQSYVDRAVQGAEAAKEALAEKEVAR